MRIVRGVVLAWVLALAVGCDSGSGTRSEGLGSASGSDGGGAGSSPSGSNPSSPSGFAVEGVWEGTATDEDSAFDVRLTLTNNGGSLGTALTGTLEIEGVTTVAFNDGFIDIRASAQKVFTIDAADDEGYTYSLRGTLTSKRLDDGQLDSSNPAIDVDAVFLDTVLVKSE